MSRGFKIFLALLLSLILLACLGVAEPIVILPGYLLVGWVAYLWRVVPQARVNWGGVAMAAACLAGVLVLGHMLARWLWRETAPPPADAVRPPWRARWTLAAATVVVLMFTAGIAAVGVTHQAAWLARQDTPWFGFRSRESANRVKCGSNIRQIGQALELYANEHGGHLPPTLAELLRNVDLTAEVFVCPSGNSERAPGETPAEQARHLHPHHCDYVYHGRGLRRPLPATRPIACEPLGNHDLAGMNVLFSDGTVEWFSPADALKVMGGTPAEGAAVRPR